MARTWLLMLPSLMLVSYLAADEKSVFGRGYPDTCLGTNNHKSTPSAESGEFEACGEWKSKSCCTVGRANSVLVNRSTGVTYLTENCQPLSQPCLDFMTAQECFYFCEPMLSYYEVPAQSGSFRNVPICGTYCDAWFDACKDDKTCVLDWVQAFYVSKTPPTCSGSDCVTFAEMYGNGTGLCNKMLATEFIYTEADTDCMVMQFAAGRDNPNVHGKPYSSSSALTFSLVLYIVSFIFVIPM